MMERYLMMIYVSLDQEQAMKKLFLDNGWKYQKPDLLKITDQLGPIFEGKVVEEQNTSQNVISAASVTSPRTMIVSPERVLTRSQKLQKSAAESDRKSKQTLAAKIDNTQSTASVSKMEEDDDDATSHDLVEYMDFEDEDNDFLENQNKDARRSRKKKDLVSNQSDENLTNAEQDILAKLDGTEDTELADANPGNIQNNEVTKLVAVSSCNKTFSAKISRSTGTGKRSRSTKKLAYQCGKCLVKFSDKPTLNKHLQDGVCCNKLCVGRKETGLDKFVATEVVALDNVSVSTEKSAIHQDVAQDKSDYKGSEEMTTGGDGKKCFVCDQPECALAFTTIYSLEIHQKVKHGLTCDNPVECNFCNKSFESEHILDLHKQDQHALLIGSVECDDCSKVCSNFSAYSTHKQSVHNTVVCLRPNKGFVCDVCGKSFVRFNSLRDHCDIVHLRIKKRKQSKSGKNKSVCDICGKEFARPTILTEHIRVVHDKTAKQYVCEECGESFLRPYILERHTNKEHLNQRPYECDKCHKNFFSRVDLRKHKSTCYKKEEDMLECTECGRRFHDMNKLKMHQEALHSETPFTCACGTVVKWRSSFAKHKRRCALGQTKNITRKIYTQRPRDKVKSDTNKVSNDTKAGMETTTKIPAGIENAKISSGALGFTTISTDQGDQVISEEIASALRDQGLLVNGTVDGTLRLEDGEGSGDQNSSQQNVYFVILKE